MFCSICKYQGIKKPASERTPVKIFPHAEVEIGGHEPEPVNNSWRKIVLLQTRGKIFA